MVHGRVGTAGDELIFVSGGGIDHHEIWGLGGNDILVGWTFANSELVSNDELYGDRKPQNGEIQYDPNTNPPGVPGNDTILGGAGNDKLYGDEGDDSLDGGINNDTLDGGEGDDILRGGSGNDILDSISGGQGDDTIYGGAGNDTLTATRGRDLLRGEQGNDTYFFDFDSLYSPLPSSIIEDPNAGIDTVNSYVNYTLGANLENLNLVGFDTEKGTGNNLDNTITGNNKNNTLNGEAGDDTLNGEDGNDTLNGGAGADLLVGGLNNDTYIVDNSSDFAIENTGAGIDEYISSANFFFMDANVENLTMSGGGVSAAGNDIANTITGNAVNNNLNGGGGNDTLNGGNGNDTLDGGAGADRLIGGLGNDTYIVDDSFDFGIEVAGQGVDIYISTATSFIMDANVENLTMSSGAVNATGTSSANEITGNAANNSINGGAGNDTIRGEAGNDNLSGAGNNDVLAGGAGNDTLTGNSGDDQFRYNTNAAFKSNAIGIDVISDFTHGGDKFVLDKTTFTSITSAVGTGFSQAKEFAIVGSNTAAAKSSADIVYNSVNGNLFYNQNGVSAGFGSGAQFAMLTNSPTLSATDFVLQA